MSKRKKIAIIASVTIFTIFASLYIAAIVIGTKDEHQQPTAVATSTAACTLDSQTFMATVNQWRSAVGAPPLAYSSLLESGAKARLADMVQGQYYGHTNPTTKEQSYTTVMRYDTAATTESEVLDGPISSAQAMVDFRNSPEHYSALTNPSYHYFGAVATYQPQSWAEYDNSGNLQAQAGTYHGDCIVIGELADKDGAVSQTTASAPMQQAQAPGKCLTLTIPKGVIYEDASWLPSGTTQTNGIGSDGSKLICDGKVTLSLVPINEVIYQGTGSASPGSYVAPVLTTYIPSPPTLTHNDCVRSLSAQAPGAGDLDNLCTTMGY